MAGKTGKVIGCAALFVVLAATAWSATEAERGSAASEQLPRGYDDLPESGNEDGPFAPRDCSFPRVKPTRIVLRCASFGIHINGISWKDWGNRRARGRGDLEFRTCRPDCKTHPVRIELHEVRRSFCGGRTLPMFKRIRLNFPRRDPNMGRTPKKLACNL
jgi:hypothetical protein